MSDKKSRFAETTAYDPRMGRPRLKEGLVPGKPGIFLRIEQGANAGTTFTLSSGGTYLIGRDGADIPLADEKVSRKHAEIGLYGPGAYIVRDLASTNGTRLNGKKISDKAKLSHWDEIKVGDTVIRFSVIDDAVPVS